ANIVTGIGFLGAGVIYQGKFTVQGLTTAAVIWSMAGIGMMIGFENYKLGFILTICMVVVLSLFQKIENLLADIYFIRTIYVTFNNNVLSSLGEFEKFIKKYKAEKLRKEVDKNG